MRRTALLAALPLTLLASAASAQGCDRACLDGVLTRYLAAVVRHDVAGAPLAAGYRETDNTLAVTPGKGVWRSVSGLGKLQRHYLDPVTGGAGFYGTIMEGDRPAIATLRLLIEGRQVTEAEWIVARLDEGTPTADGPGQTSIEGAETTPPPAGSLPRAKRVPRRVMIAAANAYFDSVQAADETLMPAVPDWVRLENGMGTGIGPGGTARGGKGMYPGREAARRAGTMQGGFQANNNRDMCGGICNIAARRYPIVDEEAGVVLGLVVFQRPPGNANRRNLLSEWFQLDGGRISGIYAAMHYMKPTFPAPNWPPYDGNFPLSFNVGISPMPAPPGTPFGGPGAPPPPPPGGPPPGPQ